MASIRPTLTLEELESAFESIGEGAIIIDTKQRVIRANNVALKILGYHASELIGQRFIDKVESLNSNHQKFNPINSPIAKAIITGRPVYEYLYYRGKKTNLTPVFVSASPIVKNAKPLGVTLIFRDISFEEAVDQMKSEFISLASHQLRTPLASIKTYSHMLLDGYMGELNQDIKPAIETIVAATNRMNELISTLLNISRLESGAIVLNVRPVNIATVAKEVINEMSVIAKTKSMNLTITVQGKPIIRSDGPIIKEVLANLISNSVKYSKENSTVSININCSPDYVSVSVKDNGFGIPDPAKSQIFSKFFRANNIIQLETSGTGLGLYLVKGLVNELGGNISFTSKEDKGTTFRLKLPKAYPAK